MGSQKECVALPMAAARVGTVASSCGQLAVWSARLVCVYQGSRLTAQPVRLSTDFVVHQVLLSHTVAVCVDSNGMVHTFPLKFKSSPETVVKIPFRPRAQGVLSCVQLEDDVTISLVRHEQLIISVHKLNNEFKILKTFPLVLEFDSNIDYQGKVILQATKDGLEGGEVRKVFNFEGKSENIMLAMFSLDRFKVFGVIVDFNKKEETLVPVKLFKCPSEITCISIDNYKDLKIIISLKSGSVVILSCQDSILQAQVVHLNCAIYKSLLVSADRLMYSDGTKLWITVLSDKDVKFDQVFVTQPKDFVKAGDRIICITFSNIMYSFSLDAGDAIIKEKTTQDGFVPVPQDLSTSKQIVCEIMKEVKENEEILTKIKAENTLMLAVALSKHQSVLDQHITILLHIVNRFDDAVNDGVDITLTRPLQDYFEDNVSLLLVTVQISTNFRQKFNELCSCLSNDIQLHIDTKSAGTKQTTAVVLNDKEDDIQCLIPVKTCNIPHVDVVVTIISPISGPVDPTHNFWTIIFSKSITLSAEHFIRVEDSFKTARRKHIKKSDEKTVLDIAKKNFGSLYDLELPQKEDVVTDWSCYLKLPKDFKATLSNSNSYSTSLSSRQSDYLAKKFGSNDFCHSKQVVHVSVCDSRILAQVINEEEFCMLRLTGRDAHIVCQLRMFLSKVLYGDCITSELVSQTLYTRVENQQRRLLELSDGASDRAAVLDVAHDFHKYTLGVLPL